MKEIKQPNGEIARKMTPGGRREAAAWILCGALVAVVFYSSPGAAAALTVGILIGTVISCLGEPPVPGACAVVPSGCRPDRHPDVEISELDVIDKSRFIVELAPGRWISTGDEQWTYLVDGATSFGSILAARRALRRVRASEGLPFPNAMVVCTP